MARASQVIVLAEDELHQRFVRCYKQKLRFSEGIRNEPLPSGRGCGEQWVRERYANAVKAYRWRSAKAETALVVVIDADVVDVDRRLRQFRDALTYAGLNPRADDETIVHLIPRRNIETWILNLNGRGVDENTDHRHERDIGMQVTSAAATLYEWTRPNARLPDHCVPSILSAIPELRRLE